MPVFPFYPCPHIHLASQGYNKKRKTNITSLATCLDEASFLHVLPAHAGSTIPGLISEHQKWHASDGLGGNREAKDKTCAFFIFWLTCLCICRFVFNICIFRLHEDVILTTFCHIRRHFDDMLMYVKEFRSTPPWGMGDSPSSL